MSPIPAQLHAAVLNPPMKNQPTVLLHSLKNPRGEEQLIWIGLVARFQLHFEGGAGGGGQPLTPPENPQVRQLRTRAERYLSVQLVDKTYGSSTVPALDAHTRLALLSLDTSALSTSITWT